ncbi:hypothetical protein Chor_010445, partial [Crotalus horridus]
MLQISSRGLRLLLRDIHGFSTRFRGFAKEQAETVVSALMSLSSVSLDTVYKDMKMKIELDQVKQQLMFTDQERKLMEASTEFHKKDSSTNSSLTEVNNKIDAEIAALKTLMESNKLETIRYLA